MADEEEWVGYVDFAPPSSPLLGYQTQLSQKKNDS
jgi:hypothetical protein